MDTKMWIEIYKFVLDKELTPVVVKLKDNAYEIRFYSDMRQFLYGFLLAGK